MTDGGTGGGFFTEPWPADPFRPPPLPAAYRHVQTRWSATPSTFGPWVKVPLTVLLVVLPLLQVLHSALTAGGTKRAFVPVVVCFLGWPAVLAARAIWVRGRTRGNADPDYPPG